MTNPPLPDGTQPPTDPYTPVDYPAHYPQLPPPVYPSPYPPPTGYGYPPPSYPPPGYAGPPGYPADPYDPYRPLKPPGTNGKAIASLVTSVVGSPAVRFSRDRRNHSWASSRCAKPSAPARTATGWRSPGSSWAVSS